MSVEYRLLPEDEEDDFDYEDEHVELEADKGAYDDDEEDDEEEKETLSEVAPQPSRVLRPRRLHPLLAARESLPHRQRKRPKRPPRRKRRRRRKRSPLLLR
jgi:hypothetical protein